MDHEVQEVIQHTLKSINNLINARDMDWDYYHELTELLSQKGSKYSPYTSVAEWDEMDKTSLGLKNLDAVIELILATPVSVLARSGWVAASDLDTLYPAEYSIVLTAGGPGIRIRGSLDIDLDPCTAKFEYRNGTQPWTEVPADSNMLLQFAGVFTFSY